MIAWVAQWVEQVNIAQLFFKCCVVSSNPVHNITFIIVKTFVFIFIKFSPFCNIFSPFCFVWSHNWQKHSIVGSVTLYSNYRMSPLKFIRYMYELRHWFPIMWHFEINRLKWGCAASFLRMEILNAVHTLLITHAPSRKNTYSVQIL